MMLEGGAMSRPDVVLRTAELADAAAIEAIYRPYVLASTATFDIEPPGLEARQAWLTDRAPQHPVVVAEADGGVIGWGSLSEYRSRAGWRLTAEIAVYVAEDERSSGVGSALVAELVDRGRTAGLHAIVSQIVAGNEPSIRLAERAGFVRVGSLREVGLKFDRWLDVEILELIL